METPREPTPPSDEAQPDDRPQELPHVRAKRRVLVRGLGGHSLPLELLFAERPAPNKDSQPTDDTHSP